MGFIGRKPGMDSFANKAGFSLMLRSNLMNRSVYSFVIDL